MSTGQQLHNDYSIHIPPELMPDANAPSAGERNRIMRDLLGDAAVDEIEEWDTNGKPDPQS